MDAEKMSAIDSLLAQLDQPDHTHVWSRDDVLNARAELSALRAKNAAMREALEDVLQAWSFNDYQHHTHSWHTREDWIGRHPVVLELARTALGGSHA